MRTCGQDGAFSGAAKTCEAVTCPPISAPRNGIVKGNCDGGYGDICTYVCNPGYWLSAMGNATRKCNQAATYSGRPKTCKAVTCPPVSVPQNGKIIGDCGGAYGDTSRSSCNPGFALSVLGDVVRTCGQDGTFSGVAKTCETVTCPPISAPQHGKISGNCDGEYGDMCTYACDLGYSLSVTGDAVRTCGQDGVYSGVAKTCKAVTCPPVPALLNGEVIGDCGGAYGDVCRSSCYTGYTLSATGDEFRTCSQDGTYSRGAKTCKAVTWPQLSAPQNGRISGDCSGRYGDICTYACNPGYSLSVTGNTIRTCNQNGAYTGAAKACEAVTCPPVPVPLNGRISGNCGGAYGNTCTYACNPGYTLSVMGDATRTCGQDGAYSGSAKTCKAVSCSPLYAQPNGMVTGGCGGAYGDKCVFSCKHGYTLSIITGDAVRTCG